MVAPSGLGDSVPWVRFDRLGVKGVGEAGTIGAAPCIMNAVVDALSGLGVHDIQMPASPLNVWNAIQQATGQQATGQQAQATNQENNCL